MISVNNVTLQFGKRRLFEGVNISFAPGNCYGIIGANGSGKSTFLKILSGEIDSTSGEVVIAPEKRLSVLKQDHFAFDEHEVLMTVIMGHKRLYEVMKEKDEIYAKPDFSDEDGIHASELESEFTELNGWDAESEAGKLLSSLGVKEELHQRKMKDIEGGQKVRVLLAQALFGNPDIILMDEPTNQLDIETAMWLEEFLINFENLSIVISHDRHFLDKVCTHVADIDYGKVQLYTGNYTFWYEASQLAMRQKADVNKRSEERKKELLEFIARFSANAAKSKQATSRKKMIDKLVIEDIKPSSRKYPFIGFEQQREAGNDLLHIDGLGKSVGGKLMFRNFNLHVNKGDKIAFVGRNDLVKSSLFQVLMSELPADEGAFKWGASTIRGYFPKDNTKYFNSTLNLIDWLRQYHKETDENFFRGFLGKVLFSGDEQLKPVNVLSGGERVRCMFAKIMLEQPNLLILDEPTNHLDLESITALNKGLQKYRGTVLFSSHDHELMQTVANRIIEITPNGYIDRQSTSFDEYLENEELKAKRDALYLEAVV